MLNEKQQETAKTVGDTCSSSMLQVLDNLQKLLEASGKCVNESAREALLLAIAIEAETLAVKIETMLERWKVTLPFKEGTDIHFMEWAARIGQWLKMLGGACPKEPTGANPQPGGVLTTEKGASGCIPKLRRLQQALMEGEKQFDHVLHVSQFSSLSTRLYYRYCQKVSEEGVRIVTQLKNSWPEESYEKNACKQKERLKKQLRDQRFGEDLSEYVHFDAPNLLENASFGKFLFKNRHELSVGDIQLIYGICSQITELNQLSAGSQSDAPSRIFGEAELHILQQLRVLAKKGRWKHTTEENILAGLDRALGNGPALPKDLEELSTLFWKQLSRRRGCDAEKSLQVAWLNFVGYCLKRDWLSGGSPALCKLFFPNCHPDDYKAIDKGRSGEVKSVQALKPLLDYCL